jgi:hypothetical protein
MIDANTTSNYKYISKVSVLDARKVFYPYSYALQKRDIQFDDDQALIIIPIPMDVEFPGTMKSGDAGSLREYKFEATINNQEPETEAQLEALDNRKVIIVLHHLYGKIIIGCNEMPLLFTFVDDNNIDPGNNAGYQISCRGTSYFLKVSI